MSEASSTPTPKLDRQRYSSKYSPKGSDSPASAAHKRSWWKKLFTPLAFFAISIGIGIFTFFVVYPPAETGIVPPYYPTMQIYTSAPIYIMGAAIGQGTPTTTVIAVKMGLVQSATSRPERGSILLTLPVGFTFICDPTAYCHNQADLVPSAEIERFIFKAGSASCFFVVNERNFSINFDGINAYAAMPEVILHLEGHGSESPLMEIGFRIPSAASYGWSSIPSIVPGSSRIAWSERLAVGDTPGQVIDGTNHARQRIDANLTFLAGALIGVAGAAFLISLQEAMQLLDRE